MTSDMIVDIIAALVVLSSALISFMRGFIREVLTIAGVVGGILAAVFLGPSFTPLVRSWFGVGVEGQDAPAKLFDIVPMEIVADITAYGIIFVAVVIALSVLSHMISGAVKAMGLGPVDRSLGVIFGIARALLLLGLFYLPFHLLMDQDRKDEYFKDSQTHFFIEKVAAFMAGYLPESDAVEKKVDDTAGDLIKQKLEDQNLLNSDDKPNTSENTSDQKKEEGYKDEQREKLDKLFNEPPTVNE